VRAPVGRGGLQRVHHHLLDLLVTDGAGPARPAGVVETVQPLRDEPAPPLSTVASPTPTDPATSLLDIPSAHASTIRARDASACEVLALRAHRCNV
jgi:hypothetical protein